MFSIGNQQSKSSPFQWDGKLLMYISINLQNIKINCVRESDYPSNRHQSHGRKLVSVVVVQWFNYSSFMLVIMEPSKDKNTHGHPEN